MNVLNERLKRTLLTRILFFLVGIYLFFEGFQVIKMLLVGNKSTLCCYFAIVVFLCNGNGGLVQGLVDSDHKSGMWCYNKQICDMIHCNSLREIHLIHKLLYIPYLQWLYFIYIRAQLKLDNLKMEVFSNPLYLCQIVIKSCNQEQFWNPYALGREDFKTVHGFFIWWRIGKMYLYSAREEWLWFHSQNH